MSSLYIKEIKQNFPVVLVNNILTNLDLWIIKNIPDPDPDLSKSRSGTLRIIRRINITMTSESGSRSVSQSNILQKLNEKRTQIGIHLNQFYFAYWIRIRNTDPHPSIIKLWFQVQQRKADRKGLDRSTGMCIVYTA